MVYVNFIGRLGKDAEKVDTKRGGMIRVTVATDDFKNNEKSTTWINLTADFERFSTMFEYLKKGKLVHVHGIEQVSTYTGKDGSTQISRDVKASGIEFVSVGKSATGDDTVASTITTGTLAQPDKVEAVASVASSVSSSDASDDLPF